MAYTSFEDLEVWQKACQLSVKVYAALKECKDYGLKDQMTRAGVSIASNIAEGAERGSPKEFVRFLHISKGSAAELRTQIYICRRIDVLSEELHRDLVKDCISISQMIHGLIRSLSVKRNT
ncbi:MAG: four helix bundle protein [Deltaproteobacteria bacterium]|nr:four helix bundle protein [Deltaproteobacteria bacterium]